jgi:hypothetical protein
MNRKWPTPILLPQNTKSASESPGADKTHFNIDVDVSRNVDLNLFLVHLNH